jgi:hypothetical protein
MKIIITENQYFKLNESSKRFKLDDKNLSTLISLLSDLETEIKTSKKRSQYFFKNIPITTLDGTEYYLPVYIDPTFETFAAIAYDTTDTPSIENLFLVVNPKYSMSKKNLYNSLYHEFLHAVDPTITTKISKKYLSKYADPNNFPELYYSHGIELRGITGEFFEALVQEYKERIKYVRDEKDRELLLGSLKNILGFFNELEPLNPLSYDIIDEMNGQRGFDSKFEKILSSIMTEYPKVSELYKDTPDYEPYFLRIIDLIQTYSQKGWKMFLTMLYSTVEEIKEIINKKNISESVQNNTVTCDKCGWSWDLSDGGDDPYICHKCGNDNSKDDLKGKKVMVYYNLHKHTFSITYKSKVIMYADYVKLKDVEFRVREGGREKVRIEKNKNVHAFVIGTLVDYCLYPCENMPKESNSNVVTYNPYKYDSFVYKNTKQPIYKAKEVDMINLKNKLFVINEIIKY